MIYARVFLVLLWVGWGSNLYGQAASAGHGVHVVMYELPEPLWQAEFEGQFPEHAALQKKLEEESAAGRVKKPVNSQVRTSVAEPGVKTKGEEQSFVCGWDTREKGRATPLETSTRFIGTKIKVEDLSSTDEDKLLVMMKLEHHLAAPQMYKINYANAATGEERDKLSVEYPKFERLEWQGQLSVGHQWRQVANVLLPPRDDTEAAADARRFLIFIKRP